MQRFSIFHPLFMSFYSRELYRDVRYRWRGIGFLYLLLLVALFTVPIMLQVHMQVSRSVGSDTGCVIERIPAVTITKGQVSIDRPVPYMIPGLDCKTPLMVIDTSRDSASLDGIEAHFLLTKNKLVARKDARETRVYDLSGIDSFYLDKQRVQGWLKIFRTWFAVAAFPFVFMWFYVVRIIVSLIYAALGLVIAAIVKTHLIYEDSLRLSTVAVTPAVVLDLLLRLLNFEIPWWGFICFVISMGYLAFGIKGSTAPGEAGQAVP